MKNDTRVRKYTQEDIDILVDMIAREVSQLPHYQRIKIDHERISYLLRMHVSDESAFMISVLVNEKNEIVGGVGGYCVTQLLSWDKTTGDIFLFVDQNWRSLQNVLKLIRAYKDWAYRRGAKLVQATHTGGYRSVEMDKLLKRAGFESIGTLYHQAEK